MEKVCVIGAGSSGITTIKALKEKGIPFDCFEMGSDVGGNWRYGNDNGRSSAYRSLHIDTSKERMAYSDYPMPDHYPSYPHHTHIIQYFDDYVDHFGLRSAITFKTRVESVAPRAAGGFDVTIRNLVTGDSQTNGYSAVLVCNGHHWNPRYPDFQGEFNGRCFHSHYYREPYEMKDETVVVVGIGNSGVDLAVDISHVAQQVYLSTRRSAHILPRFVLGQTTDKLVTPLSSRLPVGLQSKLLEGLVYMTQGSQESYGVPKPAHAFTAQHPTMSAEILSKVAHGEVHIKPNISHLTGNVVHFEDGSHVEADTLVYATGYQITFPFFDESYLSIADNDVGLYHKVVDIDRPGLYFIGLIQPLGAIMPLAELQAKWVAGLLAGDLSLPEESTMRTQINQDKTALAGRYVNVPRHTIQVDFYPYKRTLQRALDNRPEERENNLPLLLGLGTAVLGSLLLLRKLLRR